MADYTYSDMLRMQEEAAERVRQMKKRATIVMEDETENRKNIPLPDDIRHYSMPVEFEKQESESAHPPVHSTQKRAVKRKITDEKNRCTDIQVYIYLQFHLTFHFFLQIVLFSLNFLYLIHIYLLLISIRYIKKL